MTAIVLIHGAYQGGWAWQKVASRLRTAGHQVYTPSLALLDGECIADHVKRPSVTYTELTTGVARLIVSG